MTYQPRFRNQLILDQTASAFSRRPRTADETYSIHLVKADDPAYIPNDVEFWPIYTQAVIGVLQNHPELLNAAITAIRKTKQELRGLRNRDL